MSDADEAMLWDLLREPERLARVPAFLARRTACCCCGVRGEGDRGDLVRVPFPSDVLYVHEACLDVVRRAQWRRRWRRLEPDVTMRAVEGCARRLEAEAKVAAAGSRLRMDDASGEELAKATILRCLARGHWSDDGDDLRPYVAVLLGWNGGAS